MAKNTKELSAEEKLQNRISGFFERNAKTLLICAAALVVLVAIVVTVTAVSSANREKAMVRIQGLEETVIGAYAGMEDAAKADVISSLEAEEKGKSYVSFKASYLKGLAYFQDQKYQASYGLRFQEVRQLSCSCCPCECCCSTGGPGQPN